MATSNCVLFQAYAPTSGTELWVSDGTTAGTSLLKDIATGTKGSSAPSGFTQFGSKVLFAATDTAHGTELWVTNGLPAGTYLLKDINPGTTGGFVTHANGTSDLTSLHAVGNVMVFLGNDGTTGQELWVTDGTSAGTSLLKDIAAGSSSSNTVFMAPFAGKLLFQASDGVHRTANDGLTGQELWVTDGTAAGTSVLADLDPGVYASGTPKNITDLGTGKAVFSAAVGSAGRELWVTDGTAGGTSLLKDITPGFYTPSNPSKAVLVGTTGLAVFAAIGTSSHQSKGGGNYGTELWVTNGTTAGTSLLKTFSEGYSQGASAFVSNTANGTMASLGNEVLFTGSDGGKTALWGTDGTVNGTVKLSTDGVFVDPVGGTGFSNIGTKDLFWNGTGLGAAPWVTDGTAAGTFQLVTTAANADQGEASGFGVIGNKAVFNGASGSTRSLWVTDGTKAGTYDIGVSALTAPTHFASINGKVIFEGTDTSHGTELWVTDGTFLGTKLLKDINTTYAVQFSSSNPTTITGVSLACFAQGTRLATPGGTAAVESLRVGDFVVTAAGERRPVRWVGHRRIDVTRHPRPEEVLPIRIAPHTFGDNQPEQALFLSPDHAVFAGGVLIPVRALINGETIARVPTDAITYFHIELDSHDIVLAEGLPVESYLETGERDNFDDGGGAVRLFPDFSGANRAAFAWESDSHTALQVTGPIVRAVRQSLAARARSHTAPRAKANHS